MELALWLLIALVIYTYLGYGVLIYLLVKLKPRKDIIAKAGEYLPPVTLVVPAWNEEAFIAEKARNCLELDYPSDKLRILFITDGSTDDTVEILRHTAGVEVIHENRRAGKSAAENRAVKFVDTPYVIFCDANTYLNRDCVKELVKHYVDPQVGAVAGEKKIITTGNDQASGAGEGLYWKYESTLKRLDSELYSVVGAAGELISFRTDLLQDLEEDTILDDFVQSLRICQQGYRVKYEPAAYAMETASANLREELKRKIRIAAGGWQAMLRLSALLNPFRHPVLSFQYVSHRVLRWSVSAFALPVIFILSLLLWLKTSALLYGLIFIAQSLFWTMALAGWLLEQRGIKSKLLFVPLYFGIMNYAVYRGVLRFIKGRQQATWERSKRMTTTG